MKILKKICFWLFILVLFTYLFIVITPKIFTNFYPFGIKTAVVLTGSMSPAIEIDDFVITRKVDEVKVGDIVSFKEEGNSSEVLHRIVKIEDDEVTTKGDANNTEDQPIQKSQITGVYIGKIKYFGKVISFVTKPAVFSLIITSLLIIMLIPSRKSKTKEKDEKDEDS